ncbi:unnamed protein product [Durusdinium trenchii]|uniref:Cytochrome b5 heme-binding domain-containing protein n=1 Tax=Durusdinium trenchii TaxID=1381693 RepID=A0ABP0QZR1_9DINO
MRRAKRAILLMSLAAQAWSPWSFCPARLNARVGCQADRHLAGAKEDWTSAFELAASASGTKLDWLCLPCLVLLLAWPVAALSPQACHDAGQEAAARKAAKGCFMTIEGKKYDASSFVNKHPGGPVFLAKACCTDATEQFQANHRLLSEGKVQQPLRQMTCSNARKKSFGQMTAPTVRTEGSGHSEVFSLAKLPPPPWRVRSA